MKKRFFLVLLIMFCLFGTTFANDVELEGLTTIMRDTMLDNSLLGGTWSDAYIGQLLGVPPHFGIGASAGVSRLTLKELKSVLKDNGMDITISDNFIVPNYAIEARIGGLIIPFDLGARFGVLPEVKVGGLSYKNTTFGADFRIPILKGNVVLPKISIGAGFDYGKGCLKYSTNDSSMGIDFESKILEVKAQISKQVLILTPYAGISGMWAWTNTSTNLDIPYYPKSYTDTQKGIFNVRAFGGLSFNVVVLKIDLNGFYNFMSKNWAANLGIRVQI